jgi:DNA-binding NtrC family response regulator
MTQTGAARVLVVEHSSAIRGLLKTIAVHSFAPAPIEVTEKTYAEEAVEQFRSEPFHFLLVDISPAQQMKAVRELVHASHVRQRCPSIAFSTGRIDRATLEALASDHCFAIFPKPFDPSDVTLAIREALEAHVHSVDALVSPVLHGVMRLLHPHLDEG